MADSNHVGGALDAEPLLNRRHPPVATVAPRGLLTSESSEMGRELEGGGQRLAEWRLSSTDTPPATSAVNINMLRTTDDDDPFFTGGRIAGIVVNRAGLPTSVTRSARNQPPQ